MTAALNGDTKTATGKTTLESNSNITYDSTDGWSEYISAKQTKNGWTSPSDTEKGTVDIGGYATTASSVETTKGWKISYSTDGELKITEVAKS